MTETLEFDFPPTRDAMCPIEPARYGEMGGHPKRVRFWDGSTPWLITRYQDVHDILADARASSDPTIPGYPDFTAASAAAAEQRRTIVALDDPEHAVLRRMLIADFMPKRIEAMRPTVQAIVDSLIDDMLAGPQPADLVSALALPVPSLVICEVLGVPATERERFQHLAGVTGATEATVTEVVAAHDELIAFLTDLTLEKASSVPTGDLLSRLAHEQLTTGALSANEIAKLAKVLLIAGHDTSAGMIGLGTVALLKNPDQLKIVRDSQDPRVVSSAVEELLRYLTIVHRGRRRVALEDIELGGELIRAGEGMIVVLETANRDEQQFKNANVLDVQRDSHGHMAFGFGIHQCLGQSLARLELEVVNSTLFRRIPTLALAVPYESLPYRHDQFNYGVHCLPVTW
jgi:cytochrome P450